MNPDLSCFPGYLWGIPKIDKFPKTSEDAEEYAPLGNKPGQILRMIWRVASDRDHLSLAIFFSTYNSVDTP